MRLSAWAPSIIAVVYIGRIWAVNQVPYDTNEHYTKFLPVASQLLGPMLPVPAHTVKQPPNETNALRPERTSNARDQPRSNMQRTTRSAQCTTCSEQLRPRRRRMRSARLQSPWASNRRPATACRRPSPACAHPCTILRYPIDSRAYVPFTPAAVSHLCYGCARAAAHAMRRAPTRTILKQPPMSYAELADPLFQHGSDPLRVENVPVTRIGIRTRGTRWLEEEN